MPLIRNEPPAFQPTKAAPPVPGPPAPMPISAAAPAEMLRTGGPDERRSAARALAAFPDGTNTLADALKTETDPRVREAIFTSLVRIGGRESVNVVVPFIRSDNAGLRTGALDALRAMIGVVGPVLPALLSDPDPDVRLLACDLTRELPSDEATQLLCGVLAVEPEANVCAAAVDVLLEIGEAEALPLLQACAARFGDDAFLTFAVTTAMERIISRRPAGHG
jgi:HEAT repeat protein